MTVDPLPRGLRGRVGLGRGKRSDELRDKVRRVCDAAGQLFNKDECLHLFDRLPGLRHKKLHVFTLAALHGMFHTQGTERRAT